MALRLFCNFFLLLRTPPCEFLFLFLVQPLICFTKLLGFGLAIDDCLDYIKADILQLLLRLLRCVEIVTRWVTAVAVVAIFAAAAAVNGVVVVAAVTAAGVVARGIVDAAAVAATFLLTLLAGIIGGIRGRIGLFAA